MLHYHCGSRTCHAIADALTRWGASVTMLESAAESLVGPERIDLFVNTVSLGLTDGGKLERGDGITALCDYFPLIQTVGRRMAAQKCGQLIHVVSDQLMGDPERPDLAALGGGLLGLTRDLALEWRELGITLNMVTATPPETPDARHDVAAAVLALTGTSLNGQVLSTAGSAGIGRAPF